MMRIDLITLFPQMCQTVMDESIIGRAQKKGAIQIVCHQLRDYAFDKHRHVDDAPYGGGMGMVLMAEPIALCIEDITKQIGKKPYVIYMTPQGSVLNQQKVKDFSKHENVCVLCGHYEGVDERVIEEFVDEQISIGDYVLTGGELPALVFMDSLCRMVPGVLSDDECFTEESHYNGLLEHPQYTRPNPWRGKEVPPVVISGHHANVEKWRREQSIIRTAKNRPDMLEKVALSDKEQLIVNDALHNVEKQ